MGFFRRHQNHTVRTPGAVDRSGRTVFQHVDRGDVVRADVRQVAAHDAVDDYQRRSAAGHRRHAPQLDFKVAVGVSAVGAYDIQACNLSLEQLQRIGDVPLFEIIALEGGDRAGQLFFRGGTVPDHDYVVHRRD